MEIYAPDVVHEFPFTPKGAAISAYMRQLPEVIRFGSPTDVRVREVGHEFIIEATGHHRRISDDAPRDLGDVWLVTLHDGKVTHFRDYMNLLQLSHVTETERG